MQDNNIIQGAINYIKKLQKENTELKEKIIKLSEEKGHLIIENNTLKEKLTTYGAIGICEVCSDKANKLADKYLGCLQEIKAIAERLLERGLEPQSVEHQLRLRGKEELASVIIDLITKAESEDN